MIDEKWVDIEEYPGYQISSQGRVRSLYRPKILKVSRTDCGGVVVHIGKPKKKKLHIRPLLKRYFQ